VRLDNEIVDYLVWYTKVPVFRWRRGCDYHFFSWNWLALEFVKNLRIGIEMKWWTWDSWKREMDTAVCPKCGDRNFDID